MAKIDTLFDTLLSEQGSDLHLAEGQPPKIRCHGRLTKLQHPVLTADMMREYLEEICTPERWQQFLQSGDLDFAHTFGDKARFRSNYFYQAHGMGAVFRTIPTAIVTLDDLGLPPV